MKPVVIASGNLNRYGFRILPEGGRLDAYHKNPVLLWDHGSDAKQKNIPIGKCSSVILSDGKLVGTPEFDKKDEFALKIEQKWEDGYLNATSVGFGIVVISTSSDPALMLPGQTRPTITEWDLCEVSICSVPVDRDAVKLSLNEGQSIDDVIPLLTTLSHNNQNHQMDLKAIAVKLGLPADATQEQIDAKLAQLQKAESDLAAAQQQALSQRTESMITLGKTKGVIDEHNEAIYRSLAKNDIDNAEKLVTQAAAKQANTQRETLSVKDVLKGVQAANSKEAQAPAEETFEYLSKTNPEKLNEIRLKEPDRYAQLAAAYANRPSVTATA